MDIKQTNLRHIVYSYLYLNFDFYLALFWNKQMQPTLWNYRNIITNGMVPVTSVLRALS